MTNEINIADLYLFEILRFPRHQRILSSGLCCMASLSLTRTFHIIDTLNIITQPAITYSKLRFNNNF